MGRHEGEPSRFGSSVLIASLILLILALWLAPSVCWGQADQSQNRGAANAPTARASLAIVNGMLIDGRQAAPVHHSVILIDGKKIVAVGTTADTKVPAGAKIIDASGYTVMPGLIDAHVHLDMLGHADYVLWHKTHSAKGASGEALAAVSARQLLMAGVTTAIDLGGYPEVQIHIRDKINRGELVGPRMKVSAGWIWNATQEAFEAHHRGMEGYTFNVHTPEEAKVAIQKTIQFGADIVKAYSGLTAEQTKIVTEEAHKHGLKVTGHSNGDAGVLMKVANGQDGIEHMGFNVNDPEIIRQLVAHRTHIVPTVIIQAIGVKAYEWPEVIDNPRFKALTPPDLYAEIKGSIEHPEQLRYFSRGVKPDRINKQLQDIKKLYDAGVQLGVGTDSGTPINFHTDSTRQEMSFLVQAGIPAADVIKMATHGNAEWLGMADVLGTIAPGYLADLIVVDGNPLVDMEALKFVSGVVKEGIQYKSEYKSAAMSR